MGQSFSNCTKPIAWPEVVKWTVERSLGKPTEVHLMVLVVFIGFDHQIFDKGRESKRSKESIMAGDRDWECERSFNDNLRSMVPKGSPTSKDEGETWWQQRWNQDRTMKQRSMKGREKKSEDKARGHITKKRAKPIYKTHCTICKDINS